MPAFHRRTTVRCAVLTLVSGVSGCLFPSDPIGCTADLREAVAVYVRDAASNASIATGATLVLRDGPFADSITSPFYNPSDNQGALITPNTFERAGTYAVTVRRANYASWDTAGVRVTRNVCHVNTVTLTARLSPLP